jgi:hypothetical protein
LLWYEERLNSNKQTKNPCFGICCKNGNVSLPAPKEPPTYLDMLLNGDDKVSKKFRENIRSYSPAWRRNKATLGASIYL